MNHHVYSSHKNRNVYKNVIQCMSLISKHILSRPAASLFNCPHCCPVNRGSDKSWIRSTACWCLTFYCRGIIITYGLLYLKVGQYAFIPEWCFRVFYNQHEEKDLCKQSSAFAHQPISCSRSWHQGQGHSRLQPLLTETAGANHYNTSIEFWFTCNNNSF